MLPVISTSSARQDLINHLILLTAWMEAEDVQLLITQVLQTSHVFTDDINTKQSNDHIEHPPKTLPCSNEKTKECAADNYIQKHSVKKCLSKQSKDTLVDIGSMFDRWQQLKKKLCIRKDKDLAGFLLCHYESTSGQALTSTANCSRCFSPLSCTCAKCSASRKDLQYNVSSLTVYEKHHPESRLPNFIVVTTCSEQEAKESSITLACSATDLEEITSIVTPVPPIESAPAECTEDCSGSAEVLPTSSEKGSTPLKVEVITESDICITESATEHEIINEGIRTTKAEQAFDTHIGVRESRNNLHNYSQVFKPRPKKNQGHAYFYCDCCQKLINKTRVVAHMRLHSGDKPFRCCICSRAFKLPSVLRKHMKTHDSAGPYECKFCTVSYKSYAALMKHARTHVGGQLHSCTHCNQGFERRDELIKHLQTHSEKRPFKCEECGAAFKDMCFLTRHMSIHSNRRPYTCKTCGASYKLNHHLSNHMRLHTGERPHMCKVCGKTFMGSSHLARHIRTHSDQRPYKCKICSKDFKRSTHLTKHMSAHSEEKPHKCLLCKAEYKHLNNLTKHLKLHE